MGGVRMVSLAALLVKQGMPTGMRIPHKFRRWWKRTGWFGLVLLLYSICDFAVDWLSGSKNKDIAQAATNVRNVLEHAPLDASNVRLFLLTLGVVLLGLTVAFAILDRRDRTRSRGQAAQPPASLPRKSRGGGQPIACGLCEGTGKLAATHRAACTLCDGYGYIYTYRSGQPQCPSCDGNGRLYGQDASRPCHKCDGDGCLPLPVNDRRPISEKNIATTESEREHWNRQMKRAEFRRWMGTGMAAFLFFLACAGIVWLFASRAVIVWR